MRLVSLGLDVNDVSSAGKPVASDTVGESVGYGNQELYTYMHFRLRLRCRSTAEPGGEIRIMAWQRHN